MFNHVEINFSSWTSIKYFTNTNQFILSFNNFNHHHTHLIAIIVTTFIIATTLSLQCNFYIFPVSPLSPYHHHSMTSSSLSLLYYYCCCYCCCCCCFIIISNHIILLLLPCFSHYHLLNIIKKWINVHHAKEILLSTNEERYLHFGKENGEHKVWELQHYSCP